MITWSPILHFYQPYTAEKRIVSQVLHSCYLPILDILLNNPDSNATFHIAGTLTLYLEQIGQDEFSTKVHQLINNGQVELLVGPMYHPIIPLTPEDSVLRQIAAAKQMNKDFYGYEGESILFPPELAVNESMFSTKMAQCEYVLIDQTSVTADYLSEPLVENQLLTFQGQKLLVNNRTLTFIFRAYPRHLKVDALVQYLEDNSSTDMPIINVNDVEVFGHHYEERIHLFEELVTSDSIQTTTLTNAISQLEPKNIDSLQTSTWQTFKKDQGENNPFNMWSNPKNALQELYFDLLQFADKTLQSVDKPVHDVGLLYNSAATHFDRGTSSCYPYWLSNNPWWHPDFVEDGAKQLIQCVRTLPVDYGTKLEGERKYLNLLEAMWEYHWSGEVETQYAIYENNRNDLLKNMPNLN